MCSWFLLGHPTFDSTGSLGYPARRVVHHPPVFTLVTASPFLPEKRETELNLTTFSPLLLFRVFLFFSFSYLSSPSPEIYRLQCCLLGILLNHNIHICMCVCVCVYVCMCVCVRWEREKVRERGRERESVCVCEMWKKESKGERERESKRKRGRGYVGMCVWMSVCVWESENEREREREIMLIDLKGDWSYYYYLHSRPSELAKVPFPLICINNN